MKIFDLIDNRVEITSHALLIDPFSEIWKKDKSKDKLGAFRDITYIWFFVDFNSPYFSYPEKEKEILIKENVIEDKAYKVTDLVKKGIEAYRSLCTSPSLEMLEASQNVVHKMKDYFNSVDFMETQTNKQGIEEPTFDIDKISKAVTNMPKLMESLNQAREICKKEQSNSDKVRGNKDVGNFED